MRPSFAIALATLVLAASSTTHAAGTLEQRRACRSDAMKFCRKYVPHVAQITTCMEHNLRRLTPACRAQFK